MAIQLILLEHHGMNANMVNLMLQILKLMNQLKQRVQVHQVLKVQASLE